MTVTIRPYTKGRDGWEVDLVITWPDGKRHRERKRAPVTSKSAARRWGEERERHLLQHGPAAVRRGRRGSGATPEDDKEVPTIAAFVPRYIDGYCRANQQKPSTIYTKQGQLKLHILPQLGDIPLDQLRQEDIQRLKSAMSKANPKSVNCVLGTLSSMLRAAEEWGVIERMPVRIKRLKELECAHAFYDFDVYEDIVAAAAKVSPEALVIVLLGGETGLRRGEIVALEWSTIDLARGHPGASRLPAPPGPAGAPPAERRRDHRRVRPQEPRGRPATREARGEGPAHPAAYLLFPSRDARRHGAGDPAPGRPRRSRGSKSQPLEI